MLKTLKKLRAATGKNRRPPQNFRRLSVQAPDQMLIPAPERIPGMFSSGRQIYRYKTPKKNCGVLFSFNPEWLQNALV
jgi:hypothetical protein